MEFAKLWKKETNCADAQYIKIFNNASDLFKITKRMPTTKNNTISSENIRATESKSFVYLTNPEIWNDMMDYCNTSVRFAEIGSQQISIAYENRSKWFYLNGMLKKCLIDIELAKGGNCPRTLLPILEARRRNCAQALLEIGDFELPRPKLSFTPDNGIPGFANVLQIERNDEFGYHVIAKCDIDVGKTVVVEECFTSCTLIDRKGCATCQRINSNFIPCEKCTLVQFCDEDCKKKNLFHVHECGVESKDLIHTGQIITQSILIAMSTFPKVDNLIESVEKWNAEGFEMPVSILEQKDKYKMFLKLHSTFGHNLIPIEFVMGAQLSYSYLMQLLAVRKYFVAESHQRFLMHLVLKHTIVQKNAFSNTRNGLPQSMVLYTASSLFNHSCCPNLLIHNFSDQVCITSRPIKKGEQLFVSYLNSDKPTSIRQSILQEKFGFDCKCEKCKPIWKSSDREAMKSSIYYKYMKKNEHKDYQDDKTRTVLKKVCEKFLSEYGRLPWCPEIEFIVDLYENYFFYETY